jgi:N utilization substance protein B
VSARSKARKQTLDLLYEADIRGASAADLLSTRDVVEDGPDARPIREFTRELIAGITSNKRKIDELITTG